MCIRDRLFATVADLLLRYVKHSLPADIKLWAFADDTALLVPQLHFLPDVFAIFDEYASFSNLFLKLTKT
eukprot:8582576-Prorocentrum_lima.AAC.1